VQGPADVAEFLCQPVYRTGWGIGPPLHAGDDGLQRGGAEELAQRGQPIEEVKSPAMTVLRLTV
jgi:hypothetical protein